jgi:uncharacterized protein
MNSPAHSNIFSSYLHDSDLFIMPVSDRYLLYSPLRRLSALLNKSAVIEIRKTLRNNRRSVRPSIAIKDLVNEIKKRGKFPPVRSGRINPFFLGLIVTRSCNGACLYCDFGAGDADPAVMSYETAVSAVDWMAETVKNNRNDVLEIHFFGGEPMMAPDVIEVAIHRARLLASRMGIGTLFEISTNGQFDDAVARFVGDYIDTVVLSLDGPKDIHNRHRPLKAQPDSYSRAAHNAKYLGQTRAKLCLRACISHLSLPYMEEMAHFFCTEFRPSVINFEVVHQHTESLESCDPYKFAAQFIRAKCIIEQYGLKAVYASAETAETRTTFCPVGNDTVIVSPNGVVSSCYLLESAWQQKGLNLSIGNMINDSVKIDKEKLEATRHLFMSKRRCQNCFCRWTCAGGCHVENTYPECTIDYNDFCIQTRIITACTLLQNLNCDELVDSLLAQKSALQALALQVSDRLEDWGN